jgi:HAD superfamily hydrolase (TIGR01509 family)
MCRSALGEMNLKAGEVIFIDDRKKNCEGAEKLGIHSFFIV